MMRLWPWVEPSVCGGLVRVEASDRQPAQRGLPGDGGAHRAESDDGKVDLLVWHRAAS